MTESAAIICYLSDAYGQPHNRLVPLELHAAGAVPGVVLLRDQ